MDRFYEHQGTAFIWDAAKAEENILKQVFRSKKQLRFSTIRYSCFAMQAEMTKLGTLRLDSVPPESSSRWYTLNQTANTFE